MRGNVDKFYLHAKQSCIINEALYTEIFQNKNTSGLEEMTKPIGYRGY